MTMSFFTEILSQFGLLVPAPPKVANQRQAFAGMDMSPYPGDDFIRYFQNVTNIVWTGAYLGNTPAHPDTEWMVGAGNASTLGFGIAPTYVGQQAADVANTPHDLQLTTGITNGQEAVQKAATMGLRDHSVIYLDWETGNDLTPEATAYFLAWFVTVSEAGFRPALYAHGRTSVAFRKLWPQLFVWMPYPQWTLAETFMINTAKANVITRDPRKTRDGHGDPDAIAWQMWYTRYHPWEAGTIFPLPSIPLNIPTTLGDGSAAFSSARHPGFPLDISSSSTKNPCFPEETVSPGLVRGGNTGAMAVSDTSLALFRVRSGDLSAVKSTGASPRTWTAFSVDTALRLLTFHPWSPPRAVGRSADEGDLMLVTRSGALGTAEDHWDLHAYRRRGTTWTVDEAINGSTVVSPLLGICPVSRAPDALEIVFQGQDLQLYTISTVDTALQADNQPWTAPDPVPVPAGFLPSRVSGLGAVSRASGIADFFAIAKTTADPAWRLYWTTSAAPGSFAAAFALPISPDPVSKVHPFSNVAVVSRAPDSIDAFAIAMAPNSPDWRVYHWYWSTADGWGISPNAHIEAIGGTQNLPHPISKLAAVAYTAQAAQCIDVFAAGASDGFLYFTRWNGTAWSDFARIEGGNVTIASVDSAILRSPGVVDVVATGRDGNVYVATSTGGMTGYGVLTRIAQLALGAI
jgi:Domain of unknown function (DUF1906)